MNATDSFWGYPRPRGGPGIRNHVAILSVMDNVNPVTRAIAQNVAATLAITTLFGRGQYGYDREVTYRTLAGLAANPNIAAVLVVGLESSSAEEVVARLAASGKPCEFIVVAETGGTIRALEDGTRKAQRLVIDASRLRRQEYPLSQLRVGLECGGSDTTSGLGANPLMGHVADTLIDLGGTAIISETWEFLGAEHLFAERAQDPDVKREFLERIRTAEANALSRGLDVRGTNPSPDNIRGGLSTIEEKSLGAMAKAGSRPLVGVLDYGEPPTRSGLHYMDTPAAAVESMTGLSAGGCQLLLFGTGVGNTIDCTTTPTIKITANRNTAVSLADNIDFDASTLLDSEDAEMGAMTESLLAFVADVASGTLTKGEVLKQQELAISRFQPST
jgi:altronate dehydratase large subunit